MPFTWTYSKLTNYEDCPRRHYECDIMKHYDEGADKPQTKEDNPLLWGNYVHDQLAHAISKGAKLDDQLAPYQKWVDRAHKWKNLGFELLVEQRIGYTTNFQPAAWQAPGSWYRAKADLIAVKGPVAIAPDWKTGKIKKDPPIQLGLTAQYVFAKYPDVHAVQTEYVWLQEDTTTPELFKRGDMKYLWGKVLPRVQAYQKALVDQKFPPKPGGLCRSYCPVSTCQFWRKGG